MTIVKWAAVAVTALMGLMNLGVAPDDSFGTGWRVAGVVFFVAAAVAVVGLARNLTWGRAAGVAVGAANAVAAFVGAASDIEGWQIGLVVAGLGAVLSALTHATPSKAEALA